MRKRRKSGTIRRIIRKRAAEFSLPEKTKGFPVAIKNLSKTQVGQILQVYKGEIIQYLVDIDVYYHIEKLVISFHKGYIKPERLGFGISQILQDHMTANPKRCEGILQFSTTQVELGDLHIKEVLVLPAAMGPIGLIPGYDRTTTYKVSMSGDWRLSGESHLPGINFQ